MESIENNHSQMIAGFNVHSTKAPLGRRLFAHAIDSSLLAAVTYIFILGVIFVFGIGAAVFSGMLSSFKDGSLLSTILMTIITVAFVLLILSIYHGYFIYFDYNKAQTPGKKILGLKVISTNGARLTLKQCILREIFKWIDQLYIPALISMLMTEKSQRLGDIAAGTQVIFSASQEKEQDFIYMDQSDYDVFYAHLVPQEISEEESTEFLSYAGARFLYEDDDFEFDDDYWTRYFSQKVDLDDNTKVSQEDFLRFMAQLCYLKERENGSED
ncbi:RDD family protein [Bacteriovorax sp. DB6_IX]|uniref:RDD family protein n=1 Tax=Bacteriovorax sp. DB6_IX TaxID=1353530 RepID=UPI0006A7261E|nr:RDD family protein [Bacteriovorax sp. DB6_IX]